MTRCAIYTRKSSDERLDAEYSSLDNQRSYCAAYIASQGGNGWTEMPVSYDDGGFSGGSLQRPALAQLRADVAAGRVDMVVVYKIDRLSRSLRDFVNLVQEFEQSGVALVSVTQAIDTSTSMGRLMINVLLSFAQFEREITGDRLREWFAGAARRGLWKHGPRPMGYRVEDGHLVVVEEEAALVRRMFRRYAKLGSTTTVARELNAEGHINHRGRLFDRRYINARLQSRLYLGEIPHHGAYLPGIHPPIVTPAEWRRAQETMDRVRRRQTNRPRRDDAALLKGIIYGPTGHAMMHAPVKGRGGKVYRYYISTVVARYGPGSCPAGRFRADEVEHLVRALIEPLAGTPPRPRTRIELDAIVRRLVRRVDLGVDEMTVSLSTGGVLRTAIAGRVAETKRTRGWWRAPEICAIVTSQRSDEEIASELGVAYQSVSRIRHYLRRDRLIPSRGRGEIKSR